MRTIRITVHAFTLSAFLLGMTPALSQAQDTNQGFDGDLPAKGDQRDTEDHETSLDWVGLLGMLGLVGLVGPRRRAARRDPAVRKVMIVTTVIATSAALSLTTPALSQDQATGNKNERGYSIESSQEGKGDRPISIGWVGLIGLAGLLGLGLPKFGKRRDADSGDNRLGNGSRSR